jgi:hypothetical protein
MVAGHPRPCSWLHATNSPIAATNLDELARRSVSSFSQLDAALHIDEHANQVCAAQFPACLCRLPGDGERTAPAATRASTGGTRWRSRGTCSDESIHWRDLQRLCFACLINSVASNGRTRRCRYHEMPTWR